MPIPDFDHNDVLPPHVGDVTQRGNMSPFRVTTLEVVQRFGSSPPRVEILNGLLDLREDLRRVGLIGGFQWLDGSFLEDAEKLRGRPPGDIDVVTFFHPPTFPPDQSLVATLNDHTATKARYRVDHYLVPLRDNPERLVENSRFWFGLFSHQKSTAIWKGMLHIDLMSVADDVVSRQHLASLVFP
ncbi:MAG: hypothetical protein RLZZ15_3256 [Verrucomicrobiota bacterium]|jgi:hypothetical protein